MKSEDRLLKTIFGTLLILPFGFCFTYGFILFPHYLKESKSQMLIAQLARALNESTGISFYPSVWLIVWIPFFCSIPLALILQRKRQLRGLQKNSKTTE